MIKFVKKVLKRVINPQIQLQEFAEQFIKKATANGIFSGPFAGMKFIDKSVRGTHYPELLGTYELELNPIIEELCQKSFDTIINIGAGEGYYAMGLAMRNPRAHIIAFEAQAEGQSLIRQMAEINGLKDRLSIYGFCDISLLSNSMSSRRKYLVIMDVEGMERVLLDPLIIPRLRESYILVELHDCFYQGISTVISRRFQDSHKITEIESRERVFSDFPITISKIASLILKKHFVASMNEGRPERMKWFYLEPKNPEKRKI